MVDILSDIMIRNPKLEMNLSVTWIAYKKILLCSRKLYSQNKVKEINEDIKKRVLKLWYQFDVWTNELTVKRKRVFPIISIELTEIRKKILIIISYSFMLYKN
jgi:hypothetical protein